ncbi:uncharacterized protein KY384_000806 [Bacidia gigantensis]|uniref:uncharacterized protein n=1 Tax=Bacidia gigantensis TaxID=2732470 RepID=UPI001D0390C6|nr:uncharacterized protein KY384_000806 [Bacidia gigantensis]KAG8526044.1 hypothetical protein KY384_000806 [Bacidia gigantensis]
MTALTAVILVPAPVKATVLVSLPLAPLVVLEPLLPDPDPDPDPDPELVEPPELDEPLPDPDDPLPLPEDPNPEDDDEPEPEVPVVDPLLDPDDPLPDPDDEPAPPRTSRIDRSRLIRLEGILPRRLIHHHTHTLLTMGSRGLRAEDPDWFRILDGDDEVAGAGPGGEGYEAGEEAGVESLAGGGEGGLDYAVVFREEGECERVAR